MNTLRSNRSLIVWLGSVCILIISMVVIGGITRLTHSGLSMVEWKPVTGAVPPLTESAWQEVFAKYQQFPEYQKLNAGMTLSEFKFIFFWEYLHRLIGRLIGIVFFVPWLYFLWKGQIRGKLAGRLLIGFFLGGLQGALGWFMVKSGLVNDPHVSHFRLAAHLLLAFGVLSYLFWIMLGLLPEDTQVSAESRSLRLPMGLLTGALVVQVMYGAFTAGLRAGFGFNTFPKMNDEWFPSGFFQMGSFTRNVLENPIAIQFVHRTLGWLVLLSVGAFAWAARNVALSPRQKLAIRLLLAMTLIQFALGVTTLLMIVPVSVATFHQLGACVLVVFAVFANRVFAQRSAPVL